MSKRKKEHQRPWEPEPSTLLRDLGMTDQEQQRWFTAFRCGKTGLTQALWAKRLLDLLQLKHLEQDLEIVHEPGRCAGHPTIGHTRTCVHNIIGHLELLRGDIQQYLKDFPHHTEEMVVAALIYYGVAYEEIEGIRAEQRTYGYNSIQ